MAEDEFKAQARAIIEGCPFNMENAIADDLREADRENRRLRRELAWALDALEQGAVSNEILERIRRLRSSMKGTDID